MSSDESFTMSGLRKDVKALDEIAKGWRDKMIYLPADQQFATFRRAVTHVEKGMRLIEKIMERYMEEEVEGESED